ncbi:MAG TPA: hypothetical protein VNS32_23225 [Flavisolibacter sp.]|nr:hypothetical protein [Flavisolibacter sp.]
MDAKPNMPIFLTFGGAKKSLLEMDEKEREEARLSIIRRAKEKAFSKGLPIYYSIDGKLWAEYPDGHKELVKRGS